MRDRPSDWLSACVEGCEGHLKGTRCYADGRCGCLDDEVGVWGKYVGGGNGVEKMANVDGVFCGSGVYEGMQDPLQGGWW